MRGLTFNKLHDQRARGTGFFEAVECAMFGWFSDARNSASRWNRASRWDRWEGLGQGLDSDIAFKARVASLVDLSHAAGTNGGNDLVRPDAGAGEKTHIWEVRALYGTSYSDSGRPLSSVTHLPRSRHLPIASTEGSRTRNLNKIGVRLWTDCSRPLTAKTD